MTWVLLETTPANTAWEFRFTWCTFTRILPCSSPCGKKTRGETETEKGHRDNKQATRHPSVRSNIKIHQSTHTHAEKGLVWLGVFVPQAGRRARATHFVRDIRRARDDIHRNQPPPSSTPVHMYLFPLVKKKRRQEVNVFNYVVYSLATSPLPELGTSLSRRRSCPRCCSSCGTGRRGA